MKNLSKPVLKRPFTIAWSIAILITVTIPLITGQIYGENEAQELFQSVQKASLYYGSAIMGASSTIIALMLTLLSLISSRDQESDKATFIRLRAIASLCVISFIGAVILLLAISFPVGEFERIPGSWYKYIYYGVCGWNGLLAGHMISTMIIIRETAMGLIGAISPNFDDDGEET